MASTAQESEEMNNEEDAQEIEMSDTDQEDDKAVTLKTQLLQQFKEQFDIRVKKHYDAYGKSFKKPFTSDYVQEVIQNIKSFKSANRDNRKRTSSEYYFNSKYDILDTGKKEILIHKMKKFDDPIVQILPCEEYFEKLLIFHELSGHGGRDKMMYELKKKFMIPKPIVEIFLSLCVGCQMKKSQPRKGIVSRNIISTDYNAKAQLDFIDLQSIPDGEYNWILKYQDHATKFIRLRPLKKKLTTEVCSELLKIFLEHGAPRILQCDNCSDINNKLVAELVSLWPECQIEHGQPQQHQPEEFIEEKSNDIEVMLINWMSKNKTNKWSIGCYFVENHKNHSTNELIKVSPYRALFNCDPKAGLCNTDNLPSVLEKVLGETETRKEISTNCSESADNTLEKLIDEISDVSHNYTRS